ncbi:antitoxin of type II TA system, VapB [Nitrosomonas sp. Nm51]|uniref:type II toxin-antitoxin system VapB family antitoxin n=1 Tax=Nitrosomonas sp. Nm51 TaxID=133720 RepID=UPI0008B0100E|nr:type II toxin-antitoxin system VapB family antitoxin [Nitrosomonas sp. Nm51]SER52362.1 antitoxin of type II TA system, VapB [Nitrosomonas sp. Nm51]
MRTTIDLPEDLLSEAMKLTHTRTKTGVIVLALEELIRKSKIANIKRYKGKIDLEIDLDTLRNRS